MIRRSVRTFGELLITVGLIVLLFAAYEIYGKAFAVHADQSRLSGALDRQWSAAPSAGPRTGPRTDTDPLPGQGIARIYIPKLGKKWVVVQGVTPHDIKLAPGHYPSSQLPGEVGNFAVAGHRIPSIFWDLDRLSTGDTIVVETRTDWFVYAVTRDFVTEPTNISVVAANPRHPGARPTARMLTLTTCNPKWDNYQRLIVWATETRSQPKSAGEPTEIRS